MNTDTGILNVLLGLLAYCNVIMIFCLSVWTKKKKKSICISWCACVLSIIVLM